MRHRVTLAVAILIVLAVALPWAARSQSVFERMVMPGPLVEGHAKLEKDCAKCHEPFSKPAQTRLCLDCHKSIAADRHQKRGFHGKWPDAAAADCKACHSDHKGRSADIVQFDRETFNHAFTNFELRGAHKAARCDGCHTATVKFRDAPKQCVDCHKKSDPHKGRLEDKCEGCHNEQAWLKVTPFDHSKTKFPLVDAHAKVACATCHIGEKYKDLPTSCQSCHGLQDAHRGRYGTKCETCHAPKKWPQVHFDHAKSTKFPLLGRHAKVKCDTCHSGDLYRDKLATACIGCHKKNDQHKGQLGSRCEQCHNETGWRLKVRFDHDLTRFPLVGLHATVPCEECHRTPSFKDAPRTCASCHKDQHHAGRLGTNCGTCHNPNGWTLWRFDHDRQTRFALTGAHKGLQCHSCHREKAVAKISLGTDCYGCHAADDAHQGSFGRACEKCHTTATFKQGGFRR